MNQAETMQASWGGGVSPVGTSWQKLMMWMFIVTDGLLFAGMLTAYGFVRIASPVWPDQAAVFHLQFIGVMTFVLITSSATMAAAVGAAREGKRSRIVPFLGLTVVGGLIFLGMQAYEWATIIDEGGRLHTNPWGPPGFGASFFVITGFHGTHVLTGVIVLATTAVRSMMGKATSNGIEVAGLYWHFVDLVWVFVFTLFYLI